MLLDELNAFLNGFFTTFLEMACKKDIKQHSEYNLIFLFIYLCMTKKYLNSTQIVSNRNKRVLGRKKNKNAKFRFSGNKT